ncbi:MAG: hypothetical protein WCW65_00965 [Candidatus Paceibacterota bacterium]
MKIKKLDFKHFVFGQAGVQGFFGELDEHKHHRWFNIIPGFSFKNMVFVAKTITMQPRIYPSTSNTELRDGYKLKRFFPKSIWVSIRSFINGYMLNAVGLANLGAMRMFSYGKWQQRKEPFMLSFMPLGKTIGEKCLEVINFCDALKVNQDCKKPINYALQINFSCPNTGDEQKQKLSEIASVLSQFRKSLPELILIPKFNLLVEPETISALKFYCDAFCLTNTIGFGEMEDSIEWKKLFPSGKSPLTKYFGGKFKGGLSGKPLFPLLVEWLEKMQEYDDTVIIIAGGGIMEKKDIFKLSQFKIVHGVALGSVATIRPWRLQPLIKYGNEIFERREN